MIAVIGAGPAGAQTAYELAKRGEKVEIFEDHKCVGEPVACTGLVTKTIFELLTKEELDTVLVNTLKGVDVIAPDHANTRIPLYEFVVDRAALDRMLIHKAVDAGAKLNLHHRFAGKKGDTLFFKHDGQTIERTADTIIGADGPLSDVAKSAGLFGTRKFYVGLQATVHGKFDKDIFQTWFGSLAPDFFAWSVPESDTVSRVGLATQERTREYFEALLKEVGGKVVAKQAGPIPLYDSGLRACDPSQNVYLVGDAAALTKATTGGGIITGMISGQLAADCILDGKNYEAALTPLRRELWLHLVIRRALNRFALTDYDKLVSLMNNPAVRDVLSDNPREYPSRFLVKLIASEPALLKFAPKSIPALFS